MVGRPYWSAGSSWEALPEGWEWSGIVRRPSQRSGSGREWSGGHPEWSGMVGTLTKDREWSGSPSGGLGVVGRSSQMARSGQEALLEC